MLIRVDPTAAEPLFLQIAASVRGAISRGDLAPGETLPSVRELGDLLGVHMHTVRAAYAELRTEGLIDMRRGRNVTVIATHAGQAELRERVRALVATARGLGLSTTEIKQLVEEAL